METEIIEQIKDSKRHSGSRFILILFAAAVFICLFAAGCTLTVEPYSGHRPKHSDETASPPPSPSSVMYSRAGINSKDFVNIHAFLEQKDAEGIKNGTKLARSRGEKYIPNLFSAFGNCFVVNSDGRLAETHLNTVGLVGEIDLTSCETLGVFECVNTNITKINLSGIKTLKSVRVENSPVSELDISRCSGIEDFVCGKTRVSAINLKSNRENLCAEITDNYCTGISLSVFSESARKYAADISLTSEGSGFIGLEYGKREADTEAAYDYVYRAYPAEGFEVDAWISENGEECSTGTRTLGFLEDGRNKLTAVFREIRKGAPADELEARILSGETIPLNGGEPFSYNWEGIDADLTGDGFKDALRLAYRNDGDFADDPLYALSLNGERCCVWRETEQPRFYLASADGKTIQLFIDALSGETEQHKLTAHRYDIITDPTTQRTLSDEPVVSASCSMSEFIFCKNIREYLNLGYTCFLRSGDCVDLDGDGTDEQLSIQLLYDVNDRLSETVISALNAARPELPSKPLRLSARTAQADCTFADIGYELNENGMIFIAGNMLIKNTGDGSVQLYRFRVGYADGAFGEIEFLSAEEDEAE